MLVFVSNQFEPWLFINVGRKRSGLLGSFGKRFNSPFSMTPFIGITKRSRNKTQNSFESFPNLTSQHLKCIALILSDM